MANLIHLLAPILFIMLTFTTPTTLSSNNVLYSTHALWKGKNETLTYKDYALLWRREDCNLVLYGPNDTILWRTYNSGKKFIACFARLNSNGELVVGDWRSGVKSKKGEYALVLNYDGSLKIYGPGIWTSPNKLKQSYNYLEPSEGSIIPVKDSTLWSGDIAPIGTTIVKDDYKLELGWTCNMTLTNTKSRLVSWYTNTSDITRDCFVNLDRDGQLTIKYLGGATLWGNGAASDWGQEYVLALKPDGVLKVFGPVIWTASNDLFDKELITEMVTA